MFKKVFLFLWFILSVGCASKSPISWQNRVLESRVEALPLTYLEYGVEHSETILFLHGFGESKETWRFLVPKLSQKYHLILLDLKGFGASPKPKDEAYSVYDQAKLVALFMAQKQLKDVTLVGHSLGGGVSLVLALMQKDRVMPKRLKQLILINSMSYKQQLPSMLRVLNRPIIGFLAIHLASNDYMAKEAYRYAFYNDDLIPKESVEASSNYMRYPLAKYAYLQTVEQLIPDDIEMIERRYREILLRTLIMWGREDVSIGLYQGRRLHRDLKNSKLIIFSKVGHSPQEEVPQKVTREILRFMEAP